MSYTRIPNRPSPSSDDSITTSDNIIEIPAKEEPNQPIADERLSTANKDPIASPRMPNEETIDDLDGDFERLYSYYREKGLWCIITKWIAELLCLGFTIYCVGFLLLQVNWNRLHIGKCGMNAAGIKPCDLAKVLHQNPLTPLTLTRAVIAGYLGVFSVYWIFCFLVFFAQLKKTLKIRQYYYKRLNITDDDIQTLHWATVLEKVVSVERQLTVHKIVLRLMQKENYLIGMLNKGVLAFPISKWIPGAGPTVKSDGTQSHRLILSKVLEWIYIWCILQRMFDRDCLLRKDFLSNPRTIQKRLMIVGFAMLLLSPFLVVCMLVYLFLRHAEQFYNQPSTALSRRWSNLSRWIFREFNEVDHIFKNRINSGVLHASEYHKQFPSPIISNIKKFISFVSGGLAAILFIFAFLEKSLLEVQIFGHTLLWYASIFGVITTAISGTAIRNELLVSNADAAMSMVVQYTHYMPKKWRRKEGTKVVRMEFETLFPYTGMMLLEELASVFFAPYLLIFVIPKVDDILKFIVDFTSRIEGVGDVCSFSTFDFEKHGNLKYGSPRTPENPGDRSSQGKMEKSVLSFLNCYPSWVPEGENGKFFLENVATFRKQMLARHEKLPSDHHPYTLDWYHTAWRDAPSTSSGVTLRK